MGGDQIARLTDMRNWPTASDPPLQSGAILSAFMGGWKSGDWKHSLRGVVDCNLQVHIVGQSLGALVALKLAGTAPQRIKSVTVMGEPRLLLGKSSLALY